MSSGKKIMIFMIVFNIVLLLFGYVSTPFMTEFVNMMSNILGITIDTGAESVLLPTSAYVLGIFGIVVGVGAVVGGALAVLTKDLSASLRITSATIFTGLTLNTLLVFMSSELPFAIQMLVGVVIAVMWLISLTEFVGGYNW